MPDGIAVVVVTWNAADHIERCLESVRAFPTVVVDNGSTDGTVALVRERFPGVVVVEQDNKGMGGGNNAGVLASTGRYVLLLNSDAWVIGTAVEKLVAFADAHPRAAVVGPRLRNPDGSLQRSVRGDPTLWRLATEYLFLRKLGPRTNAFNAFYGGGFDYAAAAQVESLYGAALLVRREAIDEAGLFDEAFFVSFLGRLGVNADAAFATGLIFFIMTLLLALPGLVIILWEGFRRAPVPVADG